MSTIMKPIAPEAASSAVPPIPFPIPHPIPHPIPTPTPSGLVPTELVGGIGAAIGSCFRKSANQLVFVEYAGRLSTYDLFPAATVLSFGTATIKGTFSFDLDAGVESAPGAPVGTTWDLFWTQDTATKREMTPQNGAKIVNLGAVPFASVTASSLQGLPYALTPIVGNDDATNKLVTGDVFAVKTTAGNYAKVLVTSYGYNLQIEWVTYHLAAAYKVIGTGYTTPEDVIVAADGLHAFVLEESGDLVKVALASANRAGATVIASGLVNPQQFALDEAHGNAYVVEFDPAGHGNLYRFGLTPGSPKYSVLNTLHGATGLVLSSDLTYAYVAEQNAGGPGGTGTLTRITLATGSRQLIVSGLIAPFHLTWADDAESALLIPQRDPANSIVRIDLATNTSHVAVSGVAFRPSSVVLASPNQLLICCDAELESVLLSSFPSTGPLFMGIGFIPTARISSVTGLGDTTVDPTYFYQVKDVPFGGSLYITVNHLLATESGAAFFRVQAYANAALSTLLLTDLASVTDEKYIGGVLTAVTTPTVTIGGQPGFLPVHTLADLPNWYNQTLGAFLDSTALPNGLCTLYVEFVNAAGVPLNPKVPGAGTTIRVDNNACAATIVQPTLGGLPATAACGILKYTGLTAQPVVMNYTASHPNNFANYSFTLIKGVNALTPPSIGGPVSGVVSPISETASVLLGTCSIAGFAEYIYVAATANNGIGSQTQYDASAAIAFVLAP